MSLHYTIIAGSHREESQSTRVAHFIRDRLQEERSPASLDVLDLAGNPLPLFDTGLWNNASHWQVWKPYAERLQKTDALIVVTPEWAGMVPPGLKNFFLLCSNQELAHKPALIVSVSAGINGAYPIAELRMSSYKNNHLCYIPEQVIIRNAEKNLHDSKQPTSKEDEFLQNRIRYSLGILEQYGKALSQVRESGLIDHKGFGNGM